MTRLGFTALLLAACGGGYEILPHTADDECFDLACPLALGSEVIAASVYSSDIVEPIPVERASVTPAKLAAITVTDEPFAQLVFHPLVVGSGIVSVEHEGGTYERPLRVERVAATTVVLADVPASLVPGVVTRDRLALAAGSGLSVIAEHRSAAGERLLGHGLETWSISGGELLEVPRADTFSDLALRRVVRPSGAPLITVSAGVGPPLELAVVSPGSTAKLAVWIPDGGGREAGPTLALAPNRSTRLELLAFTADGRLIFGSLGDLSVASSQPDVVAIELDVVGRTLRLKGHAPGSSTLVIRYDSREVTLQLVVE